MSVVRNLSKVCKMGISFWAVMKIHFPQNLNRRSKVKKVVTGQTIPTSRAHLGAHLPVCALVRACACVHADPARYEGVRTSVLDTVIWPDGYKNLECSFIWIEIKKKPKKKTMAASEITGLVLLEITMVIDRNRLHCVRFRVFFYHPKSVCFRFFFFSFFLVKEKLVNSKTL